MGQHPPRSGWPTVGKHPNINGMPSSPPERWHTINDTAQLLGVQPTTVRDWQRAGYITTFKHNGRVWVREDDTLHHTENRTRHTGRPRKPPTPTT